jgi:hypothetical protein
LKIDEELAKEVKFRQTLGSSWGKAMKYEDTKNEVSSAIRNVKNRGRQLIYRYAIAAVFLGLVFMTGGILLNQYNNHSHQFATRDSSGEMTITPQINQQDEITSFGILDSLVLISPVSQKQFTYTDSVVFCWKPGLPNSTCIVIREMKNKQIIYKEKIVKGRKFFYIDKNFLPAGEYQWFLEGYPLKGDFKIVR